MATGFKNIGLIGKYGDPEIGDALVDLAKFLEQQNCQYIFDESSTEAISKRGMKTAKRSEIGEQCDLAIVLGGDGSLLDTARSLANYDIPLLGINQGRLGFLVDISPKEMKVRLQEIFNGQYQEEHRILLHASIEHEGKLIAESDAFNDVVVHKWEMPRMIETEVSIDGRLLTTMRSDGLIISTPTGSTAYALSSGGPILQPTLNALVIVPICPHAMSYRPIVVHGSSKIIIQVSDFPPARAQVTCDGQINLGLATGDEIHVQKKDNVIRLIHPLQHDYYEILRAKLNWGTKMS